MKVLNSHVYFKKYKVMRKFLMKMTLGETGGNEDVKGTDRG